MTGNYTSGDDDGGRAVEMYERRRGLVESYNSR